MHAGELRGRVAVILFDRSWLGRVAVRCARQVGRPRSGDFDLSWCQQSGIKTIQRIREIVLTGFEMLQIFSAARRWRYAPATRTRYAAAA